MHGNPHKMTGLILFRRTILVAYVLMYSVYAVVISSSKREGTYNYSPALLCMFAEFTKLALSLIFFSFEQNFRIEPQRIMQAFLLRDWLMIVPAFLYSVYNNLGFHNLLSYDPNIYQVLMNSRILITGFLTVLLLRRKLSGMQWISLVLLAIGCTVANYSSSTKTTGLVEMAFIVLQASLSSFAGVYNELLLKKREAGALDSIHLQNATQYIYCIVFNGVIIILTGGFATTSNDDSSQFTFTFFLIVFLQACGGLAAAMILKHFSTITKSFASSVEMLLTAFATYALLDTPLTILFFISFAMVSAAIFIYNKYPAPASPAVPAGVDEEIELALDDNNSDDAEMGLLGRQRVG